MTLTDTQALLSEATANEPLTPETFPAFIRRPGETTSVATFIVGTAEVAIYVTAEADIAAGAGAAEATALAV